MYGPWQMLASRIGDNKGVPQQEVRQFLASTDGSLDALSEYLKISS
jgi:hypothetical protein